MLKNRSFVVPQTFAWNTASFVSFLNRTGVWQWDRGEWNGKGQADLCNHYTADAARILFIV